MGNSSTNIARIQQDFMNNIVQEDQQNCIAGTQQVGSQNVIVVTGSKISGDFYGVRQAATTDASCLMVSNMESTVSNILTASLQQTNQAATSLFGNFGWTNNTNIFDITQSVTNNISQINEATCASSTIQAANQNYIYLKDTTVGGTFTGVIQESSTASNCTITNTMKATTYNQAQASATQGNTVVGMFTAIAAAIAAIIGLMVLGGIIFYASGGFSRRGATSAAAPQLTPEERELQAAQELGLTPDLLQILSQNPSTLTA